MDEYEEWICDEIEREYLKCFVPIEEWMISCPLTNKQNLQVAPEMSTEVMFLLTKNYV